MQIADRAFAADRAVIGVLWRDAEAASEQLFRIAVAPAQEIDDVERADVDDDGNAVFGDSSGCIGHFSRFSFWTTNSPRALLSPSLRAKRSNPSISKASLDCFVAAPLATTGKGSNYSATSAFICSTASMKSSLNSCTTAPADFTLSIRPTPCPTK